ncbi:hypothetical protein H2201_007753 [Coniosporium apollinis]|uniref:Adenosine deaminase domain-containing protein n=1 Tax=Coniosporium apollinis TaxID=61459 RepID=A0ABQ9NLQ9_9PEZI|nr:hypothetical protein H2201_007753 [Coniosporium apollinis]
MQNLAINDSPRKRKRSLTPNPLTGEKKMGSTDAPPPNVDEVFTQHTQDTAQQQIYAKRKEFLLREEEGSAWDRPARESASEAENRAAQLVWEIREDERDNLFGNKASEAIPGPETLDMGGQFLTNKKRIETKSRLFRIAQQMPKGCHLHLHFNAELQPAGLIEWARYLPDTMFIRSTQPLLDPKDDDVTEIVFNVMPADTPTSDIFSSDYNPEFKAPGSRPWMNWKTFREEFPRRRNGLDAETWVRKKMVLQEDEVYGMKQTVNGIWARFNQATRAFKGLLNYDDAYRRYIGEAIDSMIRERVMYTELRPMLMDKFIPSTDGQRRYDLRAQMDIILEEVAKKKQELKNRNELDKFPFGVKIIYCTPRSIPKQKMRSEMQDCINLKLQYPDLICGFDLVGAEDRPNHIGFYKDELLAFVETCKSLKIDIPFMFHAGETLLDTGGSKDPQNSNLYDSVLLNAKRIGHGYSLPRHPLLMEKFKEKKICIELCPISNELLHLCRNVKEHTFPQLLAAGIPCTVNSDNPSLFRGDCRNSSSLSHEFYQVMVGSPTMSVHGWRQLAEWSITFSCLSDMEKEEARRIFKREWEGFCCWIVDNYGH